MNYNSNQLNLDLKQEIQRWEKGALPRAQIFFGVQPEIIVNRLAQKILESIKSEVSCIYSSEYSGERSISYGKIIKSKSFDFQWGVGLLNFRKMEAMRVWFFFLLRWIYVAFAIFLPSWSRGTRKHISLLFQIGEESILRNGSDKSFVEFCDNGVVEPLKQGNLLIVEYVGKELNSTSKRITYVKHPVISLIRQAKIGLRGRLAMLYAHLRVLLECTGICLRRSELMLIADEFYYLGPVKYLDSIGRIEAIICTCSNVYVQPIWMRVLEQGKVHMIWYAQNWRPMQWIDNPIHSDFPEFETTAIDVHWVWTESFASYLRKVAHGSANVYAVGPILWYLPESCESRNVETLKLTVFDVSPYSDELSIQHGHFPNYNTAANASAFIDDLLCVVDQMRTEKSLQIDVFMKSKRGYRSVYDAGYFAKLHELDRVGALKMVDSSENIYKIIESSHLVIAYPFTSPAYVAEHMGVPVFYYDPISKILKGDFSDLPEGIPLIQGKKNLHKAIMNHVSNYAC